jgi:hypothetical protein
MMISHSHPPDRAMASSFRAVIMLRVRPGMSLPNHLPVPGLSRSREVAGELDGGRFELVVLGGGDAGGAVAGDEAVEAVGGAPDPAVGAELEDAVAEVGLGAVGGAGQGCVVVVAGLAGWSVGVVLAGVVVVGWPA